MNIDQIRDAYDANAQQMDFAMRPVESLLLGRYRRRLLRSARGEVLEVGVGSGASLPHYPASCTLTGVDLSEGMLSIARQRAHRVGIQAAFTQADAQSLPFDDSSFDTCVSQLSMCTVPDPVLALRELRRVCRPGGLVLLMEHTTSTSSLLAPICRRWAPCATRQVGCRPNRPVIELVRQARLRIDSVERHLAGVLVLVWAAP